ncbi:MAG: hypothetical protein AAF471_05215 [Myxococcota bacterium]
MTKNANSAHGTLAYGVAGILATASCIPGNGPGNSTGDQTRPEETQGEIAQLGQQLETLQPELEKKPTNPSNSSSPDVFKTASDFDCGTIDPNNTATRPKCTLQCRVSIRGGIDICERRPIPRTSPCSGLTAKNCEATDGCIVDARDGTTAAGHPYKAVCVPITAAADGSYCRLKAGMWGLSI